MNMENRYRVQESGTERAHSFVGNVLPAADLITQVLRYSVAKRHRNFAETGEIPERTILSMRFSNEAVEDYGEQLQERTQALYREGWGLKGYLYAEEEPAALLGADETVEDDIIEQILHLF